MSLRPIPAAVLAVAVAACGGRPRPPKDRPVQPTGLWLAPGGNYLAVTGGNWDERYETGAVWWIDGARIAAAVEAILDGGLPDPCARSDDGVPVCDVSAYVRSDLTRFVPTGAGIPDGREIAPGTGLLRLYVPVRDPAAVVWIDLDASVPGDEQVACNAGPDGACGPDHVVDATPGGNRLASDPASVVADPAAGVAYVPHLLDGTMTLLGLDPVSGPSVADVEGSFFREDPSGDLGLAGGFAVAVRPCDPEAPPLASRDCTRPTAVASHRYWPGFRNFSVAPGLAALLPGSDRPVLAFDAEFFEPRPLTGDVAYVPGTAGQRLLVVSTTPPGLSEVDTSLDATGRPVDRLRRTVPVCRNPNHLVVAGGAVAAPVAAVSCYGDDRVDLVDADTFAPLATVDVPGGPNHMAYDADHGWIWVASTLSDTLTVIDADATRPTYLRAVARFGPP